MLIRIDTFSEVPVYVQIIQQIKTEIAMRRLSPGDALPSVRDLAVELAINPNTVARAYLELEHEGIVYKRQGQGTFVSKRGAEVSRRERRKKIQSLLERAVVEGIALDLTTIELRNLFEDLLKKMEQSRQKMKDRAI